MPTTYFPTQQEFKDAVKQSFEEIVSDRLPDLIREATEKQIYTINEVCDLLDVSRRHLLYLRQSGQINYVKNGKKIYFRREDLTEFFDRNYIEATEVNSDE